MSTTQVSTFATTTPNRRLPITSARQRNLQSVIGNVFKVISGRTETVENREKNGKTTTLPRAVYECQTLNSKYLPLGTQLTIKIKGAQCALGPEENQALLLGKVLIVAFDDLNHWSMPANGLEGLSASNMRALNISLENAVQVPVED